MEVVNIHRANLVEEFKKVRLFKYLPDEAITDLLDRSDFVRAGAGERIIEEHAVDQFLFVVVEHSVAVHVNENGQDVYVATIGTGELVGSAVAGTCVGVSDGVSVMVGVGVGASAQLTRAMA